MEPGAGRRKPQGPREGLRLEEEVGGEGLAFFREGRVGRAWARFLPEYGKGGGGRDAVGDEEEDGLSAKGRREVVGKRGSRLGEAEEESAGQGLERFPGWEGVEESGWRKLEADGGGYWWREVGGWG